MTYIFVLDWDGTIAGRVDYQSQAFVLSRLMKRHGIRSAAHANAVPHAFTPDSKLIRPHFGEFIKTLKRFYGAEGGIHFFIYTASEKVWANQEIAWVERAYGIEFARPIFTRDDCIVDEGGNYMKSINKIWPRICRAVLRDYSVGARDEILQNRFMIVDNRQVYLDNVDKLLLCPDYDYTVFENLLEMIPAIERKKPAAQRIILSLVNGGLTCPVLAASSAPDPMKTLAQTYAWLAVKCKALSEENRVYENDDFWEYLRRLITQNSLREFNVNVIKQLQTASWKRAQKRRAQSS